MMGITYVTVILAFCAISNAEYQVTSTTEAPELNKFTEYLNIRIESDSVITNEMSEEDFYKMLLTTDSPILLTTESQKTPLEEEKIKEKVYVKVVEGKNNISPVVNLHLPKESTSTVTKESTTETQEITKDIPTATIEKIETMLENGCTILDRQVKPSKVQCQLIKKQGGPYFDQFVEGIGHKPHNCYHCCYTKMSETA